MNSLHNKNLTVGCLRELAFLFLFKFGNEVWWWLTATYWTELLAFTKYTCIVLTYPNIVILYCWCLSLKLITWNTRRNIEMDILQENLSLKEQVTKQKRQLLKLEGKLPPTTKENVDVTVVKTPLKEGLWSAFFSFSFFGGGVQL